MVEMADEDEGLAAEVPGELERLEKAVDELETKALLSGPLDANAALLTINARDGGTDANDWAEMLLRMYLALGQGPRLLRPSCSTARTTRRPASTAPRSPSAGRWPTAI